MCRSTDYYDFRSGDQNLLKIKGFFIRFSGLGSCTEPLSGSLTLLYPPRIDETVLEVSGSKVRSESPAFVTLHRLVKAKTKSGEAIYGSRERVRVGEGARFEVYSRDEKVLKGIFRRGEEGQKWKLECKCALERWDGEAAAGDEAALADVCVAVEGNVAMGESLAMVVRKTRVAFDQLEEIPEEREGVSESDGGCCCTCGEPDGAGLEERCDGDCSRPQEGGLSWAFDVGIWVMCFGVGYLVSKSLRRMKLP